MHFLDSFPLNNPSEVEIVPPSRGKKQTRLGGLARPGWGDVAEPTWPTATAEQPPPRAEATGRPAAGDEAGDEASRPR